MNTGSRQKVTFDGAIVQTGRNTTFMGNVRKHKIDFHVSQPYKPNENPFEGGIRELKRNSKELKVKRTSISEFGTS